MPDIFFDNEFRSLIDPLTPEERAGLEADLLLHGNVAPVVVWGEKGILLDGHNRYDICHQHGILLLPPKELSFPDRDSAMVWIIDNQLGRRNTPPYLRIGLVKLRADILARKDQAKANLRLAPGGDHKSEVFKNQGLSTLIKVDSVPVAPINVQAEVAKAARVSTGTVAKYDIIERQLSKDDPRREQLRRGRTLPPDIADWLSGQHALRLARTASFV